MEKKIIFVVLAMSIATIVGVGITLVVTLATRLPPIKFVSVVARHGANSPDSSYDFQKESSDFSFSNPD